ncbi:MAG: toll/interleukin-1 receptor domain-containing protein [Chitinophagaceae bacterium]|jgi:hypothetical protein|nr:toll/interleukin-1 receptor domain-containing protein [Chitinophagaceae bacterium]
MQIVDEIITEKKGKLQLILGDLTDISPEHKVDVLVVSAFPGNYTPTSTSLIGSLFSAGLSVERLASEKESDFRDQFDSWISKEINFKNIKRILCFEPEEEKNPYSMIAGIFQSIMPFATQYSIESVAMPLILTGCRGASDQMVLKELIKTSLFWLDKDFPVKTIKIVIKDISKIEQLHPLFVAHENKYLAKSVPTKYDFFISYSRKNQNFAQLIREKLQPNFRVFLDTQDIDIGTNWVNKLNTSLEKSERFIVCVSVDYLASKPCKYEFTYCNLVLINKGDDYVLPVYLYSAELPFPLQILNYHDAREGQLNKIEEFCERLIEKYTV